jgi:hypothetical protein
MIPLGKIRVAVSSTMGPGVKVDMATLFAPKA